MIVLFTKEYQSTFTPALKQEADLIHQLHTSTSTSTSTRAGAGAGGAGTVVYIFDDVGQFGPKMKPAEIQINLMDDVKVMGAFQGWWDFVCAASEDAPDIDTKHQV